MAITHTKLIYEVLAAAAKAGTKQQKIDVLKANESWALKDILRGTFDDTVQWLLPAGKPPYTPAKLDSIPTNLLQQNTKFKYFVKGGGYEKMMNVKREVMFIGMLETIHPQDAEVVLAMVAKTSPVKGITKKLVQEAFPQLILK